MNLLDDVICGRSGLFCWEEGSNYWQEHRELNFFCSWDFDLDAVGDSMGLLSGLVYYSFELFVGILGLAVDFHEDFIQFCVVLDAMVFLEKVDGERWFFRVEMFEES